MAQQPQQEMVRLSTAEKYLHRAEHAEALLEESRLRVEMLEAEIHRREDKKKVVDSAPLECAAVAVNDALIRRWGVETVDADMVALVSRTAVAAALNDPSIERILGEELTQVLLTHVLGNEA